MLQLKEPKDVPISLLKPMVPKQGTEEWLALRKEAVFTGSTMYKGLGLFKLSDQVSFLKQHLHTNVKNRMTGNIGEVTDADLMEDDTCTPVETVLSVNKQGISKQQYLNWGNENEPHAAATVLSYALPLYFPGTTFVESGASFIKCEHTHETLIEVSADGLICHVNALSGKIEEVVAETEFKCPYPPAEGSYKLPVFYDLPKHYALQVIVEMEAEPKVPQLLFACYSKESTVVSRVSFNNDLWLSAKIEVKNLLQLLKQNKVPNRRTLFSKEIIPKKISEFLDNCVELLIEVPSVADHSQH